MEKASKIVPNYVAHDRTPKRHGYVTLRRKVVVRRHLAKPHVEQLLSGYFYGDPLQMLRAFLHIMTAAGTCFLCLWSKATSVVALQIERVH